MSRDNWDRLVSAVVRRQQIWELCHDHSRTPSISTIASSEDADHDHFNQHLLDNGLAEALSVSPSAPAPLPLINPPYVSQAPEYLSDGICSVQCDVYGYGIFLLELITRQRAFYLARLAHKEDMLLVDWVKRMVGEKKWETIVDPDFGSNYYIEGDAEQLIQTAIICTQDDPEKRPRMSEIVRMLQLRDGLLAQMWEQFCEQDMPLSSRVNYVQR